jgi:hypothetical protein
MASLLIPFQAVLWTIEFQSRIPLPTGIFVCRFARRALLARAGIVVFAKTALALTKSLR